MGSELIGSNVDGNFDGEGDGKGKNDLAHISILPLAESFLATSPN